MELLYYINHFLIVALLSILIFGIVTMLRQGINRPHAKFIVFTLLFWLLVFFRIYCEYVTKGGIHVDYNRSVLDFRMILMGIPCFFALVTYPLITLHSKIFRSWRLLLNFAPILVACTLYFVYCWVAGVDPFRIYTSYAEIGENITTTPVLLRISVLAILLFYVVTILINLWRIAPIYAKLTKGNFSGSTYNVKWIKTLSLLIGVVGFFYFCMVFFRFTIVNTLYMSAVLVLFYYIIEKAEFTTSFDDMSKLGLNWSFHKGWHIPARKRVVRTTPIDLNELAVEVCDWLKNERPYANPNFTTAHILEQFPQLTNEDLRKIFRLNGSTFQSYIRELRIKRACYLIENYKADTNLKELYSAVGFAHYSSFSRSFIDLVGESPSDYIQHHKG